jgi:hypothetical protein
MAMIKHGTGKIEKYTDASGEEVTVKTAEVDADTDPNLVWADEKIKDALDVNVLTDITLDINASDDDDDTIAKDC